MKIVSHYDKQTRKRVLDECFHDIVKTPDGKTHSMYMYKGFAWNGASIPRFLWSTFYPPFHSKVEEASLIHDALYGTNQLVTLKLSRRDADYIFWQKLLDHDVPKFKAWLMWAAVRLFGWFHYKAKDHTSF